MTSPIADQEYWLALDRLGAVQDRESNLIGHRMTWLMTLNGFLLAGTAALIASRDDLTNFGTSQMTSWSWTVTLLASVGLLSNLSILYSNYWADRAIQSADAAFMNMMTDSMDDGDARRYLRLAGRDPKNRPRRRDGGWQAAPFLSPVEKVLHPWFLLPGAFSAALFALPALEIVEHKSWWAKFGTQLAVFTVLGAILIFSKRRERREPAAHLRDALRDRKLQVEARVRQGGEAYPEEVAEIQHAIRAVKPIVKEQRLGSFVRALGARSGKPNLVLLFEGGSRDQRVVLKVHGRPQLAEGDVQTAWGREGLCVVPVLASGDSPTTWLLMQEIVGKTLSPDMSRDERLEATGTLAAMMRQAHELPLPESVEPTLGDEVGRHLKVAVTTLERHGYPVRAELVARCREVYRAAPFVRLHGDLSINNVMRDERHQHLYVLDPCGYVGPAAFDAARWCARFEDADFAVEALEQWLLHEPLADQSLAYELLGAELLMQAGVRELVKDESGAPHSRRRDSRTLELLEASERLLSS